MIKNYFQKLFLIYLGVFIILLPAALYISYQQNDEWVYYSTVTNFLKGNFSIHPYSAASFYSIGFLASGFAKVFGIARIPVLTLLMSVSSIFILNLIIIKHYKIKFIDSIVISSIVLVNPLFVYSMWGFMTENYFLFFSLLALYFVFEFNSGVNQKVNFIVANLLIITAYLARQIGLVVSLAFIANLMWKRKYTYAFFQLIIFLALLTFHFFVFPKGGDVIENKFMFSNLTYFRYIISLFYVILIYLGVFLLPLFLILNIRLFSSSTKTRAILISVITFVTMLFMKYYLKNIGWIGEYFYYLNNTVNVNGFFPENLHGIKPSAASVYSLYRILDVLGKVVGITTLIYAFNTLRKKNSRDSNIGLSVCLPVLLIYLLLLVISIKVYDRYLILLFPVALLAVLPKNINLKGWEKFLTLIFILLIGFYSYNYSADYIITNHYVWTKASVVSKTEGISKNEFVASVAWDYIYPQSKNVIYKFTYDDSSKQNYSKDYKLVEKFNIDFPFSIWRNNNVYLYKRLEVSSVTP